MAGSNNEEDYGVESKKVVIKPPEVHLDSQADTEYYL